MSSELSIEDILRRLVESGRRLESFERRTHRVTDRGGERTETNATFIRVGNDHHEWTDRDDWMWQEELRYGGRKYVRETKDSQWKTEDQLGWSTVAMGTITAERQPGWDESLFSENYGLDFGEFLQAIRLPDETHAGTRVIRLSVTHTLPLDMPALDEMMEKMLPGRVQDPEGKLDELRKQFSLAPDGMELKEDLLIDGQDFRVAAVEVDCTVYRAGEVIESFVETRSYSKFNEAELPGPLP